MPDPVPGRWAKLSVGFFRHPKVSNLSAEDQIRFLKLVTFCAEYLTDGEITKQQIGTQWALKWSRAVPSLDRLVSAGLVDVGTSADRWMVHDFRDWQETKEQAEARREANRERQRNFHAKKKSGKTNGRITPLVTPLANAVSNAAREEESSSVLKNRTELLANDPALAPVAPAHSQAEERPISEFMGASGLPWMKALTDAKRMDR